MTVRTRTATRNNVNAALRSYIHLQKRTMTDDGFGTLVPGGPFVTQFSVYANFRPLLRGSATGVEDVFADRIDGNQPFIVTVRRSQQMLDVTTAWQMVDARNPNKKYNIKSPPSDLDNGNMWLEFIAVLGAPS